MVALAVTSSVLLTKSSVQESSISSIHKAEPAGLILSASEFKLGFENLTRSFQAFINPVHKLTDDSHYELIKKFHSTFTNVSFKYLYVLQFFQCKEQNLFLDLRKILI